MATKPDAYKYSFRKASDRIFHAGITNDLERWESDHQKKWNSRHIEQVYRKARDAAFEWEAEQRKKAKPAGP